MTPIKRNGKQTTQERGRITPGDAADDAHGDRPVGTRELDRLVDGELPEPHRAALLSRLEDEPDGWKRCALAFLEAQAWSDAVGEGAAAVERGAPAGAAMQDGPPPPPRRFPVAACLRYAAMLLLAFGLGWMLSDARDAGPRGGLPGHRVGDDGAAAPHGPLPGADGDGASLRTVGVMRFNPSGDDSGETITVPIIAGPGVDETWLRGRTLEIPKYIEARMQRAGYEIQRDRQLVAVNVEDGRQVVVPVEKVRWQYVGHRVH